MSIFKRLKYAFGHNRANRIHTYIQHHIPSHSRILDIGSGDGILDDILARKGHKITPIDIGNYSCIPHITPILFNGTDIPFKNQSFDVALIITVLHHVAHHDVLLSEAKRVAKRVIIIEDVYASTWQRYLTYIMDSIMNLEFIGHPHSNLSLQLWLKKFKKLGFTVHHAETVPFWGLFLSATFVLHSKPSNK